MPKRFWRKNARGQFGAKSSARANIALRVGLEATKMR